MGCEISRDELVAFCKGELAEADTARVQTHLSYCDSCRAMLREVFAEIDGVTAQIDEGDLPESGPTVIGSPPETSDTAPTIKTPPPDELDYSPTADRIGSASGGSSLFMSGAIEPGGSPTDLKIGNYVIQEEIGRGGMGIVYRAEQQSPKRVVALKVMTASAMLSESDRKRFQREAESVADLKHPGIVPVYEYGETNGIPYFSMEFVEGKPLTKYCGDTALSLREKAAMMAKVCDAVAYAHRRGVIHRDLKLANILVDENGQPRVLDFGLAKKVNESSEGETQSLLTTHGQIMGTIAYMAPEQTKGDPASIETRSDVYSLGVILYRLITGEFPYDVKGDPISVLRRIQEDDPIPPKRVLKKIASDLETIMLKALEKDKELRYQSAASLGRDLRHFLAGEPIEARRLSILYTLKKSIVKHKAISSMAVLAMSVVAAVLFYAAARVRAAWLETEQALQRAEAGKIAAQRELYFNYLARSAPLIQQGDCRPAMELLKAADPTFRGWEWDHLMCQCRAKCPRFLFGVPCVASFLFSPNSRQIAVADSSDRVKLLDRQTGKEAAGIPDALAQCEILRFSSGGSLIGATRAADAPVLDASTGGKIGRIMCARRGPGRVCISPDGRFFAFTSVFLGKAAVYDAVSGAQVMDISCAPDAGCEPVISGDGSSLAFCSLDRVVRVASLSGGERADLPIAGGTVVRMALDSKGGRLAAAVTDGTIRVFDVKSKTQLASYPVFSARASAFAFIASGDGFSFVSEADLLRFETLGNSSGAKEIRTPLPVTCLAASPSSDCAAAGLEDGRILVIENGAVIRELSGEHAAQSLCFDRTGTLLGAQRGKSLLLWNLSDGALVSETPVAGRAFWMPQRHGEALLACAAIDDAIHVKDSPESSGVRVGTSDEASWPVGFSADGVLLGVGCADGSLELWDWRSGERRFRAGGAALPPRSFKTSQTGRHCVVHFMDGRLRLWRADSDSVEIVADRYAMDVEQASFSPDGAVLACGNREGEIELIDTATGNAAATARGHSLPVTTVQFSADGRSFVSGAEDGMVRIWDAKTNLTRGVIRIDDAYPVIARLSPDGATLGVLLSGGEARFWDIREGAPYKLSHNPQPFGGGVAFSADGTRLASSWGDVQVLETSTGRRIAGFDVKDPVAVAFAPKSSLLATADANNDILILDSASGKTIKTLKGHTGPARNCVFTPDEQFLISGSYDNTVRLWPLTSESPGAVLGSHPDKVTALAVHPGGVWAASGDKNGGIIIWDLKAGKMLKALSGHAKRVNDLQYSPDGGFLASASYDGTVRLWETDSEKHQPRSYFQWQWDEEQTKKPEGPSNRPLLTFDPGSGPIRGVCFSPDSRRVVAVVMDRTLRVIDTVEGRELSRIRIPLPSPLGTAFTGGGGRLACALSGGDLMIYESDRIWVEGRAIPLKEFGE
ncbi:MAG TPA: protein kinase [Candidatus Brocadiia bacterium]|nr:protein kinase [Candidatus Brocadiia bacterium]